MHAPTYTLAFPPFPFIHTLIQKNYMYAHNNTHDIFSQTGMRDFVRKYYNDHERMSTLIYTHTFSYMHTHTLPPPPTHRRYPVTPACLTSCVDNSTIMRVCPLSYTLTFSYMRTPPPPSHTYTHTHTSTHTHTHTGDIQSPWRA